MTAYAVIARQYHFSLAYGGELAPIEGLDKDLSDSVNDGVITLSRARTTQQSRSES